jgi:hypothetical protein
MRWRLSGDWLWLATWGLVSSLWCLGAAAQLGATFDEPIYLNRGLEGWRTFSHRGLLMLGTMPLPIDVQTLPLHFSERLSGVQFDPVEDFSTMLFWARAGALPFWWLLLVYARLAGRQLAGPWGGRLAVALIACEPNLLAHAALATTDIAISACLLALLYHFRAGREAGWRRRCGVPGLWFGLALLAKASALVYGPICLVVVELERLVHAGALACPPGTPWGARAGHAWGRFRPVLRDLAAIGGLGVVVMFVYCGCDFEPEPTFLRWARELPDSRFAAAMRWLAEHLRLFSNAGEGLVRQIKHNMHGHNTYLLGQASPRALWYYFPLLLTIKLSTPLLLAPLAVGAARARALANWACLAAAVLLVCSLNFRVQIGIRLVLPLVVLAVVGLSGACVAAVHGGAVGLRPRLLAGAAVLAVVWNAGAALAVWPHGLCYVNELWGGTDNGYHLVSDSNYDWGQGVPDLAAWQRQHDAEVIDLWYFGNDPTVDALPVHHVPLHGLGVERPSDVLSHLEGRYLAVSTTLLYGQVTNDGSHAVAAAFLRSCPIAGRTRTFLIFERRTLEQYAAAR